MKKALYQLVKLWVKLSLHLYFRQIKTYGLENVPRDRAVLFLPNHQNALLDVLLIAVDCDRKPYFLTRSDVFKGKWLTAVFEFFQMIPIYRIRDGREAIKHNQEVFGRCSELLTANQALLMFPEANHNLKRRVRPLSKGFTRILWSTFDSNDQLDVHLIPVGMNYQNATAFPDRVALYFGKSIPSRVFYDPGDIRSSVTAIKNKVTNELQKLTTHIDDEAAYASIVQTLDVMKVDYLDPKTVNRKIEQLSSTDFGVHGTPKRPKDPIRKLVYLLFILANSPMIFLWKKVIKPKVWEPEFIATLRFAFVLVGYPFYFGLLFVTLTVYCSLKMALAVLILLFLLNWAYVKWS